MLTKTSGYRPRALEAAAACANLAGIRMPSCGQAALRADLQNEIRCLIARTRSLPSDNVTCGVDHHFKGIEAALTQQATSVG
jgi:hypothetical protein